MARVPPTVIRMQLWLRLIILAFEASFLVTAVAYFAQGMIGLGLLNLLGLAVLGPLVVAIWRSRLVIDFEAGVIRRHGLRDWAPDLRLRDVRRVRYATGGRPGNRMLWLSAAEVVTERRRGSVFPVREGRVFIGTGFYPVGKALRVIAPWALAQPGLEMDARTERMLRKYGSH